MAQRIYQKTSENNLNAVDVDSMTLWSSRKL